MAFDYEKYIKELEDYIRGGKFTNAETQTANELINKWKKKAGISTPTATPTPIASPAMSSTDPNMPSNALRNVLAGTGVGIDWNQDSKMVTLTNPAANKKIQFPTGQGQQYGLTGGHVNNYNVVDNVNLLLDSLGLPPAASSITQGLYTAPTYQAPAAFESPYSDNIAALLAAIQGDTYTGYDYKSDPVYQSYKKEYEAEGKHAFNDQIGNLTAMTGGRLNSYATAAASQAQNAYNRQLTGMIPELADRDYARYQAQKQDKYNQLQALLGLENTAYGRYRDTVGDTRYGFETEYGTYRDRVNDFINQRNYNRDVFESDRAFDRGVLESDRAFDEGVRQFDTTYNRNVFESDRGFDEDVRRFDNTFDRNVFESDRNYKRGVLESDRDYDLRKDEFDYKREQQKKEELEQTPPTAGQLSNYHQIRDGLLNRFSSPTDALAYVNKMGKDLYLNLIGENLYNQLLADLQAGFQQPESETLGAIYEAMMNAPDPEAWLRENASFMTNDEIKQAVKWAPRERQIELLRELLGYGG